jgi:RNA polymerase sigma factor (sigma-70 family)
VTRAGAGRSTGLVDRKSDEQLLAMARLGDDAAFEAIVGRYRSPLLRHCRRVAGGSNAQDALQQALLSAWRALRGDCDVRDLRRWLFTIAHRSALRARREQDARFGELPGTLAGSRSALEELEQSARVKETLAAIAALPPLERDALVSTAVHGTSGRDAAHALGVSEGTLRQLVFRARARTRAAVHVVLPLPVLAKLSHLGRRVSAAVSSSPVFCWQETGARLLKIAVLAAVTAVLGTHLTILPEGQRRPATSSARSLPSARDTARSRPTAARDRRSCVARSDPFQRTRGSGASGACDREPTPDRCKPPDHNRGGRRAPQACDELRASLDSTGRGGVRTESGRGGHRPDRRGHGTRPSGHGSNPPGCRRGRRAAAADARERGRQRSRRRATGRRRHHRSRPARPSAGTRPACTGEVEQ